MVLNRINMTKEVELRTLEQLYTQGMDASHNVEANRHDCNANEWQPFGHLHRETFRQSFAQYHVSTLAVELLE